MALLAMTNILEGSPLCTAVNKTMVVTENEDGIWHIDTDNDEYAFIGYAAHDLLAGMPVLPEDTRQFPVTVGLLKKQLANLDDDLPVIMQKDAEGNGYSPCEGVDQRVYEEENSYSGQCHHPERDAEYLEEGEIETIPCACLWPSN